MPHDSTRLPITRIARLWAAETEQPGADPDGIADDLVDAVLRGDFQFPVEILRRDELVRMLLERLPELARKLLPGGVRKDTDWVQVCKDKDGPGGSICVHLEGQHACTWSRLQPRLLGTSAAVRSGGVLDLIAYLIGNDNQDQAAQWALIWLGRPAPTNIDIRLRVRVETFYRDGTLADANSLQLQLKASTNDEKGRQWLARNVLISKEGLQQPSNGSAAGC